LAAVIPVCSEQYQSNEFIDRVTISPLRILRSEAVQDCCLGGFDIKQAQDGSRLEVGLCFTIGGLHVIDQ
jgi:hypothetical protein